jgi:hypothetical protein
MKKRIVFGAIVAVLWLALPAAAAAPIVSFGTGVLEVPVGQTVPLPVSVADIQDLYGIEFHLRFDPAVVQVADADPSTSGVQVAEGDFLSADFVAQNEVDNQAGTIDYAVTQVNPNEPRSGGGTLLTIPFQGVGAGRTSQLEVEAVILTTRDGDVIPVTVTDEEIRVKDAPAIGDTATPSPTSGPPAAPPSVTATPQAPALGDTPPPALTSTPTPAVEAATVSPPPSATPDQVSIAPSATLPGQPGPTTATRPPQMVVTGATAAPGAITVAPPSVGKTPLSSSTPETIQSTPAAVAKVSSSNPGKAILDPGALEKPGASEQQQNQPEQPASPALLVGAGALLGLAAVAGAVMLWLSLRRRHA